MSCADGSLVAGHLRALAALVESDQLVLGLLAGSILGIALAVIMFVGHREPAGAPPPGGTPLLGARRATLNARAYWATSSGVTSSRPKP